MSKLDQIAREALRICEHVREPECPGERLGVCKECLKAALLQLGEAVLERAALATFEDAEDCCGACPDAIRSIKVGEI